MPGRFFRHPLIKIGVWILVVALAAGLIKVQIATDDRFGLSIVQFLSSLQFYLGWIGIGTVLIGIWRADFSVLANVRGQENEKDISDFEKFLEGDSARKYLSPVEQHKSYEAWRASQKKGTD
ncbi:MAG: hypothetical protein AAGA58_20215 [Verrucomicrobiota bacterium]